MSTVILSELSGQAKVLYGEVQGAIKSVLMREDEAWMHSEQEVASKLFKSVQSNHRVEGYAAMSAFDDWLPVGENGEHPGSSTEQTHLKFIPNEVWKSEFIISRELMDDAQIGELKNRPQGFIDAYHRTRQKFFASMLVSALLNKAKLTIKGFDFDTTCADGSNLFSANHRMKVKGDAQCNAYKDAFSVDALTKLQTQMQNFKDDKGNILNLAPDTIIIPNDAALKQEVLGVLSAMRDPATPGGNKGNPQQGMWNVIVWPLLNEAIGSSNVPYILMDSQYNQRRDCLIDQKRVDLEIKSDVTHNDALRWAGYARFGAGFVDFRAVAAGGLTYGGNL